ncbi:MAG: histidine triad family protein [Halanaerobiales bacterium]|nr:histidine triad family protein [Halanaerobiales bacterium]
MMQDCLFCKIANEELDTDFVYQDDKVVVFKDINPQAPVHLLIVPRKHIPTILDLKEEDKELVGYIYLLAARLAREEGIAEDGFRVVSNCNEQGGQTVFHIHFHLLGGRNLQWPPG